MKTTADVIREYPTLHGGGFACRQGEYGTTTYLIDHEGDAKIVAQWLIENFEFSDDARRWTKHTRSYGWKHIAENVLGQKVGGYVSNGVFIAAAVMAGVPIRPIKDSPNARIGVTEQFLKRFNKTRQRRNQSTVYI